MSRFPIVRACNGMVASPHYLASAAGLDVLRRGGNAVDAAIATNAVLNVVYPDNCSPGGDLFMLLWDAAGHRLRALNGSGRSPALATIDRFAGLGLTEMPAGGPLTITVPGVVDAWTEALAAKGTMGLGELLQPAIGYAENGFPVSANLSQSISTSEGWLADSPEAVSMCFRGGKALQPGDVLAQPNLAMSLKRIAKGGREAFYRGELAAEIVQFVESRGGLLRLDDMAEHHSDWVEPISTDYRGYQVYEFPPNSQGLTALLELNIMEGFDPPAGGRFSPGWLHSMVEAKKLAFADRDRYISDPERVRIPLVELLSKSYATERRSLIEAEHAAQEYSPRKAGAGDTIYLCVVDCEGNAVSLIQSVYHAFGCGLVAGDTGIILQNRGAYFSLDPSHTNRIEPRKRTLHTLMPGMVFKQGEPWLVFGTMGGDGQPQTHLQVFSNILDYGMGVQEAIEAPRWLSGRLKLGPGENVLFIEDRLEPHLLEELSRRGHLVRPVDEWMSMMGHAHGIMIDQRTGVLEGGSDPRSDGLPLGW